MTRAGAGRIPNRLFRRKRRAGLDASLRSRGNSAATAATARND